jgi:hypothetical protein
MARRRANRSRERWTHAEVVQLLAHLDYFLREQRKLITNPDVNQTIEYLVKAIDGNTHNDDAIYKQLCDIARRWVRKPRKWQFEDLVENGMVALDGADSDLKRAVKTARKKIEDGAPNTPRTTRSGRIIVRQRSPSTDLRFEAPEESRVAATIFCAPPIPSPSFLVTKRDRVKVTPSSSVSSFAFVS